MFITISLVFNLKSDSITISYFTFFKLLFNLSLGNYHLLLYIIWYFLLALLIILRLLLLLRIIEKLVIYFLHSNFWHFRFILLLLKKIVNQNYSHLLRSHLVLEIIILLFILSKSNEYILRDQIFILVF